MMMAIDPEEQRRKNYNLRRSIKDYGMGVMISGFGIFLIIDRRLGFLSIEPFPRYCLAVLFIVYGSFRIYRGYKKNYY